MPPPASDVPGSMFGKPPWPASPLRNRTVDLLLTINSCGFVSLQVRRLTSQKASADQHQQARYRHWRATRSATQAASGSHITLSDGVQITLSDGAVIRFRAIDLPASDYLGRQASRRCATVSTVTTCFWSSTIYSARYSPRPVTHTPPSGEPGLLAQAARADSNRAGQMLIQRSRSWQRQPGQSPPGGRGEY